MPIATTEVIREITWNGPLSITTAVALGSLLALAMVTSLWQRRRDLGWAASLFLILLRSISLALVLWMLLDPTQTTRKQTYIPSSVTMLVDRSESMEVVDSETEMERMRWHSTTSQNLSNHESTVYVTLTDKIAVDLGIAHDSFRTAYGLLHQFTTRSVLMDRIQIGCRFIDRALAHAHRLSQITPANGANTVHELVRDIEDMLRVPASQLKAALGTHATPDMTMIAGTLDRLLADLPALEGQLDTLTKLLSGPDDVPTRDLRGEERDGKLASRHEKVESVLAHVMEHELPQYGSRLRAWRVDFAESPTIPMPLGGVDGADRDPLLSSGTTPSGGSGIEPGAIPARGTNLSAALSQLRLGQLRNGSRAAILFSDGGHNLSADLSPGQLAAGLAETPLYVVPLGNVTPLRDVILHHFNAPRAVAIEDAIVITAVVTAYRYQGSQATVRLTHNDQEVDRAELIFDRDQIDRHVSFRVPAGSAGVKEFQLQVAPLDGESSSHNNSAKASVNVMRSKTHVLLADRIPRWEFRYLVQLFRRDPQIRFDRILYQPEFLAEGTVAAPQHMPRTVDEWSQYDVVILGDLAPDQLTPDSVASLREFVEKRHGNLVVIAGADYMPHRHTTSGLLELLPVQERPGHSDQQRYTLQPTTEGKENVAVQIEKETDAMVRAWQTPYQATGITRLSSYCQPKHSAHSLLAAVAAESSPIRNLEGEEGSTESSFLTWQQVGSGRVAYLAAPITYQLRYRRGDTYHHRFWGQMLRWLPTAGQGMGTDRIQLETDARDYLPGTDVEVRVRLWDAKHQPVPNAVVEISATHQGISQPEKERSVQEHHVRLAPDATLPGRYVGHVKPTHPGTYAIQITSIAGSDNWQSELVRVREMSVVVAPLANNETTHTSCNRRLLEEIAANSGGRVIPATAVSEILELAACQATGQEHVEHQAMWNRWWSLCSVFGCCSLEWIVRKYRGFA